MMTVAAKKSFWNFFGKDEFSKEIAVTAEEMEQANKAYGPEMERILYLKKEEMEDGVVDYRLRVTEWPDTGPGKARLKFLAATSGISFGLAILPTIAKAAVGNVSHDLYDIPTDVDMDNVSNSMTFTFDYNGEVSEHNAYLTLSGDVDGDIEAYNIYGDVDGHGVGQIGKATGDGNIIADVELRIEDGRINGVAEGTTVSGTYQGQGTGNFTGIVKTDYGDQGQLVSDIELEGVFNEDGTFTGRVGDMQLKNGILTGNLRGELVNGRFNVDIKAHNVAFDYIGKFVGRSDATAFYSKLEGSGVGTITRAPEAGSGTGTGAGYLDGKAPGYLHTTPLFQTIFAAASAGSAGGFWRQLVNRKKSRKAAAELVDDIHCFLQKVSPTYRWRTKTDLDEEDKIKSIDYVLKESKLPAWLMFQEGLEDRHVPPVVTFIRELYSSPDYQAGKRPEMDEPEYRKRILENVKKIKEAVDFIQPASEVAAAEA